MKTRMDLAHDFGRYSLEHASATGADKLIPPTDDQLDTLESIQGAGRDDGDAGWYPDGDFSSDADWCNVIGAQIQRLETELDIDDGSVFGLYQDAHSEHFQDGTINPADRDMYTRNSRFDFSFGAYGDTHISVWAQTGHIRDALELAAEHLKEIEPGHFVSDEEMSEQFRIDLADLDPTADPATVWQTDNDLASRASEQATTDLTYTESGYLRAWEWFVNEIDG
jgi:hypothetical protein